jgi:hypothetical protein
MMLCTAEKLKYGTAMVIAQLVLLPHAVRAYLLAQACNDVACPMLFSRSTSDWQTPAALERAVIAVTL